MRSLKGVNLEKEKGKELHLEKFNYKTSGRRVEEEMVTEQEAPGCRSRPNKVWCVKRQRKQVSQGGEGDRLCFNFLWEVEAWSLAEREDGEERNFRCRLPS